MNWYKLAAALRADNVLNDVANLAKAELPGNWREVKREDWRPAEYQQRRGLVELLGDNVKTPNDRYFVRAFYWIKPGNPVVTYDPFVGHKLLSFYGFVEATPHPSHHDASLAPEVQTLWDAGREGHRSGLQRIGDFENIDTPDAVVSQIKRIIDGKGDNEEQETTPKQPVTPTSLQPVTV
jgi:hypothetical protein